MAYQRQHRDIGRMRQPGVAMIVAPSGSWPLKFELLQERRGVDNDFSGLQIGRTRIGDHRQC